MLRSGSRGASGIMELVVLHCLAGEEMYGYQLVQAVRERTGGEIEMREGLIYPLLHELAATGRLSSRRTTVEGRPRVYYRLTAKGRNQLKDLRADWDRIVGAMKRVLA